MGKPTGFMEYLRAPAHLRPAMERIGDWDEFHGHLEESVLREQGARCMDCGIPFCHTGRIINGAASGCPINNLIPEWNDLVYRGKWEEANLRLNKTNDFPEFTGRVCPAPCEGSCTVGISAPAVTIKQIEVEIAEHAWENGLIRPEPPLVRTGTTVAIVGSGPAGLAAARQLNRAGHLVTVYERADRVGGLLMYGIPNMKLDKRIVDRRIQVMTAEGITFVTGVEIGRDIPAQRLLDEFDAVVIATGSTVPRDLRVPGREAAGVHYAMDFLHANTKSLLDSRHVDGAYISAKDRRVVVIGGGDTGTDCVGTSVRHGATSVVQLEIMDRPPDERAPDNPWPQWPRVYKLDYGQEEAKALWGDDPRQYAVATKRFLTDAAGRVRGLELVRVDWGVGADGRVAMTEVPGSERILEADLVLLALGFVGPERSLPEQLGCELDARGNIVAGENKQTTVPGVFTAGDCTRGQSLVVWAIAEGRAAARGVDDYLQGEFVADHPDWGSRTAEVA